jgi:hypothetical protein
MLRRQFEEAFTDALITLGSPEEAAQLLWEAARRGKLGPSKSCAAGLPQKRIPCG